MKKLAKKRYIKENDVQDPEPQNLNPLLTQMEKVDENDDYDDDDNNESHPDYTVIIESFGSAVFFLLFFIYNILYWSWLLFYNSDYIHWNTVNTTLNVET